MPVKDDDNSDNFVSTAKSVTMSIALTLKYLAVY